MQREGNRCRVYTALTWCLVVLSGCASTEEAIEANDLLEPASRKAHAFNDTLDRKILEPVSEVYVKVTTERMRRSVGNFFDNLNQPNVIANDFLQGKVHQGIRDALRFTFNSTLGIGGLFDVASGMDLPRHEEDFGQTLAVWGVHEGSYLELPLLGPSSVRDAPGIAFAIFTSPLYFVDSLAVSMSLRAVEVVDTRAKLASAIELRRRTALDPYTFTREAYRQRRQFLIYDGDPPLEEFDDSFFEDEFEEEPFPEEPPLEEPAGEAPSSEAPAPGEAAPETASPEAPPEVPAASPAQ